MDLSRVKRVAVLVLVILTSFFLASFLSNSILSLLSLSGPVAFILGLVLYAGFFFGILTLFERYSGIRVFGLDLR